MTGSLSQLEAYSAPHRSVAAGSSTPRIAVVQHGDLAEAQRIIDAGQPEPYFGMARSVTALRTLTHGCPHLVISLDAPAYRITNHEGTLVGLPLPMNPAWLPGTVPLLRRAHAIRRCLADFRPTHVLLRAAGLLGLAVLDWCVRRRIATLVILADFLHPQGRRQRWETRRFIRLLNHPCVYAVGNHRRPATQSLVDCGLSADKAVAYDFAPARHPLHYPPKSLDGARPATIVYAGNLLAGKGVGDLIAAMKWLTEIGVAAMVTVAGTGPALADLQRQAATLPPGLVTFAGQLSNDRVFDLMRRAALVCVPSRHDYAEGLPLTLTEALASRTPVVASDHPVLTRAFRHGEGLRFFPAGDAVALAQTMASVLADPLAYQTLSRTTADAYARVECATLMDDLIARWRNTFRS